MSTLTIPMIQKPESFWTSCAARAFRECTSRFRCRCLAIGVSPGSRIESCDVVIRVYDEAGNVIETHENTGRVQRAVSTTTLPISGEMLLLVWPVQLYRLLRTVCAAISSHQAGALTFWAIYSAQYATTNPRLLRFTLPRA